MCTTNVSRNAPLRLSVVLLSLLWLLSACSGGTPTSTQTGTGGKGVYTSPAQTPKAATPTHPITLPDEGVAATVPVGPNPDITVESGSATRLTFVGADTQNISTNIYALPYQKKGNTVLINFGQSLSQALIITVPRKANLTVTLTAGNVIADTMQGQVVITLANGTIQVKNFAPHGTDIIETKSGTIDVTFAKDASCSLKAQTGFGAIVSGYSAISEKRDGMQAVASGTINAGSGANVNLTTNYGSITIGPA